MPGRAARRLDAKIISFIRGRRDPRRVSAAFERLALEIFSYQYARNPIYRKYCRALGAGPRTVRAWTQVPALPVAAYKEAPVRCFPSRAVRLRFRTSGTTSGGARRGTHELDTDRLYRASLWASFARNLLADGAKPDLYLLVPPPKVKPDSSLSFMAGEVARRLRRRARSYVTADLRVDSPRLAADLSRQRRPVLIFATAFSLKIFLDDLARRRVRLRLPAGSRLMETGGFKGRTAAVSRSRLYRMCRQRLGLGPGRCHAEYGMTELSSQAYATGEGGRFKLPHWMRVVAAHPQTGRPLAHGKRGVLRFYDLANRPSVAAVQTEDTGRVYKDGFVLTGRLGGAELRGCSLSYERYLTRRGPRGV